VNPSATLHNPVVELRIRDLLLNALTVSSGAVDAISFLALGRVFSAFMTGNIAFLGLRVAGASAPGAVAILTAIGAFAAGVYLSTHIIQPSQGSGMWPRRVTAALGVSLNAHAIFLAVWFANNGMPSNNVAHVLLGLWGFAMGMQSAAVRRLRVDGVFTTAATATIIFLVGDLANGPLQLKRGGAWQACSSLYSPAPRQEVCSWLKPTSLRPSCHS
jgi:uncharacterized membrane protein YoaK (UPF0700 family)